MMDIYHAALGRAGLEDYIPEASSIGVQDLTRFEGFFYAPLDVARSGVGLIAAYWQQSPWFALVNTLIAILAWAFFGGAVCRMVALQFARDERPSMMQALRFACRRYASLVASPIALFIAIGLMALPAFFVAGIVLLIPYVGEVVAGVLFFITLGLGVILTFLFLFGVSSLGLQMPAIGAEGRDAFDAISRGVNYVFTRPWKYILYTGFSLIYLCFSFVLVRLFAFLVLKIPYGFLKLWPWIGKEAADGTPGKLARVWAEPTAYELFKMPEGAVGSEYVSAVIIGIFIVVLLGTMLSFIPSFVLTAQTIIYFLLRRQIDFKDLKEVYVEDEGTGPAALEKTEETVVEPEPSGGGQADPHESTT